MGREKCKLLPVKIVSLISFFQSLESNYQIHIHNQNIYLCAKQNQRVFNTRWWLLPWPTTRCIIYMRTVTPKTWQSPLGWLWRKEGNVLFNDALNTFHFRLYGVRHMGKGPLGYHMGYSFQLAARVSFICIIPQTEWHIPWPLFNEPWSTGLDDYDVIHPWKHCNNDNMRCSLSCNVWSTRNEFGGQNQCEKQLG